MSENNLTSKGYTADCARDNPSLQSKKKEELDADTVLSYLRNGKSLKDIFQDISKERIVEIISQNLKGDRDWNFTLLHYAILLDDINLVKDLLSFGADVNAGDEHDRPIHFVESVCVAKLLIKFGVDLQAKNPFGRNLLVTSFRRNNYSLVRFLLTEKYADSMDIKKHSDFDEKNFTDKIILRRIWNSD